MKTHIRLLTAVSCLFLYQMISAQQVYQAHHYGSPGDIYLYNRFAPGLLNDEVTQGGAGVTWDVSGQTDLNTHANEILQPDQAINQFNFLTICALGGFSTFDCFEVWNNTDQAVQLNDSLLLLDFILHDLQRYQSKEGNLLLENFIGFTVELGGTPTQAVIVYQIPDTIFHFPVNYGDAWNSQTRYGLDLNPAGENILYSSTQSRITTIDGWGTVQTPYDTFENVIRLRSEILRLDTIIQDDTDTITLIADQIEYMWLDTNYSLPVMTANGRITPNDSVILTAVEYIYEATCAAPTWIIDAGPGPFYLDETGNANINFTVLNPNASSFSWDFGDGQFGESTGDISHIYDDPGTYAVAIFGCMEDCLPLNSCSFQLVNVEVVDSTTATTNVDGRSLGINIYPNPASERLIILIPDDLGMYTYHIVDITGREIALGVTNNSLTTLDTLLFSNGLYTVRFKSISDHDAPVAYSRFLILKD